MSRVSFLFFLGAHQGCTVLSGPRSLLLWLELVKSLLRGLQPLGALGALKVHSRLGPLVDNIPYVCLLCPFSTPHSLKLSCTQVFEPAGVTVHCLLPRPLPSFQLIPQALPDIPAEEVVPTPPPFLFTLWALRQGTHCHLVGLIICFPAKLVAFKFFDSHSRNTFYIWLNVYVYVCEPCMCIQVDTPHRPISPPWNLAQFEFWVFCFLFCCLVCFAVLGIQPRITHMVGKYSTFELHLQPFKIVFKTWDSVLMCLLKDIYSSFNIVNFNSINFQHKHHHFGYQV